MPNTADPDPVSSDRAVARFALEGVARNVATPVPNPAIPVLTGRPVQLVKVPEVGVPKIGVTKVGVFANTFAPVPVSSVKADARLAEEGVAKKVATPAASPLIPVLTGNPVQLVKVPDVGVPKTGDTSVGVLAKTLAPVPVSSVNADARLAEEGVAKNVATPAANPETPVEIGSPVQFVNVPLVGVPRTGVVNVGVFAKTKAPVPVSSVTAVAKLALEGVARKVDTPVPSPEMPVLTGSPVQLVSVPDVGVPKDGVVKAGDTNVPSVTVLPVNVNEEGRLYVGFPLAPSPFVTVISLAVPVWTLVCCTPVVVVFCTNPVAKLPIACALGKLASVV